MLICILLSIPVKTKSRGWGRSKRVDRLLLRLDWCYKIVFLWKESSIDSWFVVDTSGKNCFLDLLWSRLQHAFYCVLAVVITFLDKFNISFKGTAKNSGPLTLTSLVSSSSVQFLSAVLKSICANVTFFRA